MSLSVWFTNRISSLFTVRLDFHIYVEYKRTTFHLFLRASRSANGKHGRKTWLGNRKISIKLDNTDNVSLKTRKNITSNANEHSYAVTSEGKIPQKIFFRSSPSESALSKAKVDKLTFLIRAFHRISRCARFRQPKISRRSRGAPFYKL